MRFNTLACDYDGTLSLDGTVDEPTIESLERFRAAGGALLLVTGREMDDLLRIFPHTEMFERVIAENGGLLYCPQTRQSRGLANPPPPELVTSLRRNRVEPLSIGRVIIATREPHQHAVLAAIHDLCLEYHIIFNKGAVMVLPSGVNKATGLKAALKELNLAPKQIAGVGDAENDHAFLQICGFSIAVANALPAVKQHVNWVTPSAAGRGIAELVERLLREPEQPEATRAESMLIRAGER